jgi:hypothetical protein
MLIDESKVESESLSKEHKIFNQQKMEKKRNLNQRQSLQSLLQKERVKDLVDFGAKKPMLKI